MKSIAVVTYPGHFFLTALCLRSLSTFYPETKNYFVVYDDTASAKWDNYLEDSRSCYYGPWLGQLTYVPFTAVDPRIGTVESGWFRQQLTKLCIDQILPGDDWLVVDGDVIMDSRCDITSITPVDLRDHASSPLSQSVARYTGYMLGKEDYHLDYQGQYAITSSVPFRHLSRDQLTLMRKQVERTHDRDFVDLHLDLLANQEIVAYDPSGQKMVMHEWELIEAFNQIRSPNQFAITVVGSGHEYETHTSCIDSDFRFRQGYRRDKDIGQEWFRQQLISVPDDLWSKALAWN